MFNEIYIFKFNIENIVKEILDLGVSVLIVDDNSPDNTRKLVEKIMENKSNLYLLNRNKKLAEKAASGDPQALKAAQKVLDQEMANVKKRIRDEP